MRFSKAKTKREAILAALEDYIRRQRVEAFIRDTAGAFPDFLTNEEIERADVAEMDELLRQDRTRDSSR